MDWRQLTSALDSVVSVHFAPDGGLLWSNAGFQRLRRGSEMQALRSFSSPRLEPWLKALPTTPSCVHDGLLTVAAPDERMVSLRGQVIVGPDGLWVFAGYDMAELEGTSEALLELNGALQQSQRELGRANRLLRQREAEIELLSRTDVLTGVRNRRGLDEALASESARLARHGGPVSMALLDIDHFKRVNDGHGHTVGDRVLRGVGQLLLSMARQSDCVARFGGEEFVILLPLAQLEEATVFAQRVRQAVQDLVLPAAPRVTASLGVVQWSPLEDADTVFGRADAALYRAKHGGRNRVESSAGDASSVTTI